MKNRYTYSLLAALSLTVAASPCLALFGADTNPDPASIDFASLPDPNDPLYDFSINRYLGTYLWYPDEDSGNFIEQRGGIWLKDLPMVTSTEDFNQYFEPGLSSPFVPLDVIDTFPWLKNHMEMKEANPDRVYFEVGRALFTDDPDYRLAPYEFDGLIKIVQQERRDDNHRPFWVGTLRAYDEVLDPLAYAIIGWDHADPFMWNTEFHPQISWAANFGWYYTPVEEGEYNPRGEGWKYNPSHGWFYVAGESPWTYFHGLDGVWWVSNPTYHPWVYHIATGEWYFYLEGTQYPQRWFWSPATDWIIESDI